MIRQAIVTTFYGPTNTKGSRVKAQCDAKTMWFSWDYDLGVTENHQHAAARLVADLGWTRGRRCYSLEGGSLPGKGAPGYAWIMG